MENAADAADELSDRLAVIGSMDASCLPDDALIELAAAVERLGRRLDALRVSAAAEVWERSRSELGAEGLAARKGCRTASEFLQRITLASGATVDRRIRLGRLTRARASMTGESLPAAFPHVAAAMEAGELGIDSASVVVRGLESVRHKAGAIAVAAAEFELVASATGNGPDSTMPCTADELRIQALTWQNYLDQDGRMPDDDIVMKRRSFDLGREREGLVPVRGHLLPEIAGKLITVLDACMSPRTAPAFLSEEERIERELTHDPRTRGQQRHDILAGIIDMAARSGELPAIGGAPPTVLVTVRQADLENGRGVGYLDGLVSPLSMRTVKQFACTGGTQSVALDDDGRIIALGSPQRTFTPQQRRAIAVRDGGCIIPGCQVPASWCEIHHVTPAAHGGPTHTDNGVLLCWFHHRTIASSGWHVRMLSGVPQIKAPPWLDGAGRWRTARRSRTRLMDEVGLRHERRGQRHIDASAPPAKSQTPSTARAIRK